MKIPAISNVWKQTLLNNLSSSDAVYLTNDFHWDDVPPDEKFEIEGTEFEEDLFDSLKIEKPLGKCDLTNAKIVYEGLRGLTPAIARDDRVWIALAHYFGAGFTVDRHVDKEETRKKRHLSILKFFFAIDPNAKGIRALTRTHGLSRLWWTAHTASKIGAPSLDECLKIFGSDTDFRNQLMERPTNANGPPAVRSTCLARQAVSASGKKVSREQLRDWMVEINFIGGGTLLAAQNPDDLTQKFEALLNIQANQKQELT